MPQLNRVVSKYRLLANAMYTAFVVLACALLLFKLYGVYENRHIPETHSSILRDTDFLRGHRSWGSMGYLKLQIFSAGHGRFTDAVFTNVEESDWRSHLDPFEHSSGINPSINISADGLTVIVDMTTVTPKVPLGERFSFPEIPVSVKVSESSGPRYNRYFGLFTSSSDHPEDWVFQMTVTMPQVTSTRQRYELHFSKQVVPDHTTVFIGYPGSTPPTKEIFSTRFLASYIEPNLRGYDVTLGLYLQELNVNVTEPVSILSQVAAVLGQCGGWIALFSTVFSIVFVSVDPNPQCHQLTLRGIKPARAARKQANHLANKLQESLVDPQL